MTPAIAWLGVLCYDFQIFYDFSGYTDMAIGLAQMLGFRFPENFNQPYTAASVTEFWRRWHMTLTRWFRDYVYVPLGGNRSGGARTYLNLFVVFFLCGLWHGAAWTFVVWGMYHGILLVIERLLRNRFNFQARGLAGVIVTFLLVSIGWVFFRSTSIVGAFHYLAVMAGVGAGAALTPHYLTDFLTASTAFYLVVAAIFAFVPSGFADRFGAGARTGVALAKGSFSVAALLLGIAYVSETTFRPFIYFRF
jgi:alginate O-acetyltransferase complex protein AlgI